MERAMPKMLLAVCAAAVIAATFAPTEASARHRIRGYAWGDVGWSAADFCGGRLPAYGTDACGEREFSYGPGSCWRRVVVHTLDGPFARRVNICSARGA